MVVAQDLLIDNEVDSHRNPSGDDDTRAGQDSDSMHGSIAKRAELFQLDHTQT